jgi:hypothetical protein
VSISPIFYELLFCGKVFFTALLKVWVRNFCRLSFYCQFFATQIIGGAKELVVLVATSNINNELKEWAPH